MLSGLSNMVNRDSLNDLARKITSLLPENMQQMQDDLESNIRTLLQNALAKMNLVTREEFDVQTALLERTREKLEKLEKLLEELEQKTG
jgi:BMFP domain-containing protein YqiC